MSPSISRRQAISGLAGAGLVAGALGSAAATGLSSAGQAIARPRLTTYRNSGCQCCEKWVDAARSHGFQVEVKIVPDVEAMKAKLGLPKSLTSCHTTVGGGYVLEGHLPLDAVDRLFAQRPKIRGIALPGMPTGSPGMEVAGVQRKSFALYAFNARGKISRF